MGKDVAEGKTGGGKRKEKKRKQQRRRISHPGGFADELKRTVDR